VADACEGLHAAHELRDGDGEPLHVNPSRTSRRRTCFVTYDGAVKVVDFGLVRSDRRKHKTKTGMVKGKFAYVAPEAIAMKRLDRRVDVWSLVSSSGRCSPGSACSNGTARWTRCWR
jgi:serine/threonine-protein kinase